MNTLPIAPFAGEYLTKIAGGPDRWRPCQVVGVLTPDTAASYGRFMIVITDEDGVMTVDCVDAVRRVA